MRRWLTRLAVFLLLGAIVNVAVAWGCAAWVDTYQSGKGYKYAVLATPQGYFWIVRGESARGAERVHSQIMVHSYANPTETAISPPDLIPSWSTISPEIDLGPPVVFDNQIQDARGWPLLSMRCTFLRTGAKPGPITGREVVGGYELPPRSWTRGLIPGTKLRALPYIPIPLGFVVNTLFYAAFIGISITGALAGRRVIRRARGHCIKCGYDLRGASGGGGGGVCPECGASGRSPRALLVGNCRRS